MKSMDKGKSHGKFSDTKTKFKQTAFEVKPDIKGNRKQRRLAKKVAK